VERGRLRRKRRSGTSSSTTRSSSAGTATICPRSPAGDGGRKRLPRACVPQRPTTSDRGGGERERVRDQARGDGVEPDRAAHRDDGHPVDRQRPSACRADAAGTRQECVCARSLQPDAAGTRDLRVGRSRRQGRHRLRPGRMELRRVRGADARAAVVDNNAYTNLMARENLRYAARTVESLRVTEPDAHNALVHKTALEPSEVEAWIRAAESMYVPYDEKVKIIPQDDNFLDKEPWDFRNTPRDHYPLLLFYHPLDIYRKQVIKQADVVLAMFLLGDQFSLEAKKRNFEFYDPLTTGDSSLSSCVEAIIAAQIGDIEKAIRYGMAALLMDLADVGGNVKDGCHIASMG